MRNSYKALLAILAGFTMHCPLQVSAQKTGMHVLKNFPIHGSGGWDYITVDGETRRIYVSHGMQVNVLNESTGDSVGVIQNTRGVHGIALVPELNKGYTSNGGANNISVFNLKTNEVLKQVPAGTGPDAIFYDDFSKKIYAFNGRSKDATVIDAATDKVVATIPLGGKPETGVSDGKGKIFVNIENTNEEVEINAATYKVVHRWKLTGGDEPSGLAIDRATNRLFIGCGGNKTMIVLNALNGKILAKFPIGDCDGVAFDDVLKQAYSSNGDGSVSVIREMNANKFVFVENIKTEKGARTIAIDTKTHMIYLPTAATKPGVVSATNPNGWPQPIPGTFHVIVVGK